MRFRSGPIPFRPLPTAVRYLLGAILAAAALGLTLLLEPWLERATFLVFAVAVVGTAWLGGAGPALLATAIAVGGAEFLLLPPTGSFRLHAGTDLLALCALGLVSLGVAWLAARARQAIVDLEERGRQLRLERGAAEEGMRRAALMAEAAHILTASLDYESAFEELARFACREIADYCITYVLEDDTIRRVGAAHADPAREPLVHRLLEIRPPSLDDPYGAGRVIRTGEVVLASDIPAEMLRRAAVGPDHLRVLEELAPVSSMVLPLRARGRTVGAIAFATTARSDRRYGDSDLELARELAARAALALDNVLLLRKARSEVTERQKAEAALQRREGEIRAVVEHAPDVIARLDREQRYLYVNPAIEEATGLPAERFPGRTNAELGLEGDFRQKGARAVERVFASGRPETVEFGVAGPEGIRWYSARMVPEPGPDGEVESVLCMARDITERKAAEARQALLIEAGRLFTSSLDRDTTLANVAELAVRTLADWCVVDLLDEDGEELERLEVAASDPERRRLARRIQQRYPPRVDDPSSLLGQVVREGEPLLVRRVEDPLLQAVARDEEHLRLLRALDVGSVMIVPLTVRGRTLGAISLLTDRSGRVYGDDDLALAAELAVQAALALDNARLYREVRRAVQVRDDFLGVVAHELRNPLNAVAAVASLLEEPEAREPPERLAGMLHTAVRHSERLIRDLLDVSRMEAGRFEVSPGAVDVEELLEEACAHGRLQGEDREIRIDHPADGCPPVAADRARVIQVLSNLIENALNVSPPGTRVSVGATHRGEWIEFAVVDEGPGISEEDIPHLFERFWQGRRKSGGAGLGLAIVRGIVEAHDGDVRVESRPGEGATFWFRLPVAPVDDGEAEAPSSRDDRARSGATGAP